MCNKLNLIFRVMFVVSIFVILYYDIVWFVVRVNVT